MSTEYTIRQADASVVLKKGAGRTLKGGGLWVYDNEIARIDGAYENGDILTVRDFDGFFLGYGFLNDHSTIRVRLLSRRKEEPVTPSLIRARMQAAWAYRRRVMRTPADLTACRLLFGEADLLPGITVDRFGEVLVLESLALGTDRMKLLIAESLVDVLAADGHSIRGVYERSDARVRGSEGLPRTKGWLLPPRENGVPDGAETAPAADSSAGQSSPSTLVPIEENGLRFLVDIENGQKTGFFLDQKYNRLAIRPLCDKARVLDCFTHTGAFALNAAAGGAREVLAVDASDMGIAQARENAGLNGFLDRIRFETADVFDLLPALEKRGERFDVVILDPPAFTKSRASVKKAVSGYREINLRGLKLVKNGGFLATCSCSHFLAPALFTKTIAEAARGAHRRLRQVEFRTQAPDHPILWTGAQENENSYYLKFYIFQVMDD